MKWLRLTAVVAVLSLAYGCGSPPEDSDKEFTANGDLDSLVSAAKEEGKLTWYAGLGEATVQKVIAGFEDKYGIKVDYIYGPIGTLSQRFASERQAGAVQADLINTSDLTFFRKALEDKWITKVDDQDVPALADWPEDALVDGTYPMIAIGPLGIAYNTDKVKNPPTDWADLTSDEFKGQMYIGNPSLLTYRNLYMFLRDELGDDAFAKIASAGKVPESMSAAAQSVAAGESLVAIPSLDALVKPLADKGAPIKMVIPDKTTGVEQYLGVVDEAPHPAAARLFMNYVLTEEGQELVTDGLYASVLPNVPNALALPKEYVAGLSDAAIADVETKEIEKFLGIK